ncbi:condensation domain-containing protein [Polymorphospora sp. NPDC050346]|uniref:condensation domain-containing protein n=1 Tax=Polymorphospora sp. NPDC050346 TaxID=3155780 RepID=UPI0033FF4D24
MSGLEGTVQPVEPVAEKWTAADFTGTESPSAPFTWGQRMLWRAFEMYPPNRTMVNISRVVPVPRRARTGVPDVLRVIGALVGRHSSLRTRLRTVDGELLQVVSGHGEQPVLLVHAGPADDDGTATAQALATRLASTAFDLAEELPQRVALVVAGDRVCQVVLVFSHTTVDFGAVEIVLRDLRVLLLRGSIAAPPGLQSVDIAGREQEERHRRRAQRAIVRWVDWFGRLPKETLPELGPPLTPLFRQGTLVSAAADTAVRLVANRHGVTTSTVLLTAIAAVHAGWSGRDTVGIFMMVNNRSLPGYDTAIAKLNQLGMIVVDLADRPDFAKLLPRVWAAALEAYRSAYYEQAELLRAYEAAGHKINTGESAHCYFNDIRLSTDASVFGRETGEDEVRAAMSRSSFSWGESYDSFVYRTRVEVVDKPGGIGLTLTANTAYLPPEQAERFLRDLERLLVDAAFHDVPAPWVRPHVTA